MIEQQKPNYGPSIEERLLPPIAPFRALMTSIMQSLRVALPAVVVDFHPGPPATVVVRIPMLEFVEANAPGSVEQPADVVNLSTPPNQLPLLHDVPVVMPSAGGWSVTLPIAAGDECLVIFADACIDAWLQSGSATPQMPMSQRRHHLSDGIAVFGLRSTPRGLANYSTSSMQLRKDDGTVKVDLASDGITVTAPSLVINTIGPTQINAGGDVDVSSATKVVIEGSGHTFIEGRDFMFHAHSLAGGGATGPVL